MLIHCTMEELISIRDGEGSAAARQHLDACDACMEEMERLHQRIAHLKALPAFEAPRDRWSEVERVVRGDRRKRYAGLIGWSSLAAAASIALLIGLRGLSVAADDPSKEVAQLIEESQHLESMLRAIKPSSRVMNGRMASVVVQLEDGIELIDVTLEELSRRRRNAVELEQLWRRRVQLMDALVTTHAARTASYVGF